MRTGDKCFVEHSCAWYQCARLLYSYRSSIRPMYRRLVSSSCTMTAGLEEVKDGAEDESMSIAQYCCWIE